MQILIDLLHPDVEYDDADLISIALRGISDVFTLQTLSKSDFCRLFVKAGFLGHLIVVFTTRMSQLGVQREPPSIVHEQIDMMSEMLLLFSQGDTIVKEDMCSIIDPLLRLMEPNDLDLFDNAFFSKTLLKLLKCIRNLSMDPHTVDKLEAAGAIHTLVVVLENVSSSQKKVQDGLVSQLTEKNVMNVVIHTMFYICRINRSRQTQVSFV